MTSSAEEETELDKMLFLINKNGILYKSIHSMSKQGLVTYDLKDEIDDNKKEIERIVKLYKKYEKFYKKRVIRL